MATTQQRPTKTGKLFDLAAQGQSVWLDFITRDLLKSGELRRMIESDGLRGMTSNPTIFQNAIGKGTDYDEQIKELIAAGKDTSAIFEAVAIKDIQDACDLFRPLYDSTDGLDGLVSIEVSPTLAHDTEKTLADARRLWQEVDRPNVMIKVPGTAAGIPAIKVLLSEGINVNITLLFSLPSHKQVMWAYVEALEARAQAGQPVDHIASVASFFVSRVDTLADKLIDEKIAAVAPSGPEAATLKAIQGKVAVANAKVAYENFQHIFGGARFKALAAKGARVQRPLWASTGTKNKAYSDVLYVDSLIGPDTVNTLPPATLEAFMDHGTVARTVDQGVAEAHKTLDALKVAGVEIDTVTQQLEKEGVASFAKSFEDLLAGVEAKREQKEEEMNRD